MATRAFDGILFCEHFFKEDLSRNIPAKFGPNWPSGLVRCLKKLLTTHDGHSSTLKAPLEHGVLG